MAGASLLTLLDDISALLDDVSVMTKVAAKKTAGVLGDDLALNAEQVTGVRANRELPVVWAVAKGSLVNKAILVPAALAISAWLPWAIPWLMMLGGAYLCFEGVEKVAHKLLHSSKEDAEQHQAHVEHVASDGDMAVLERAKVKGAVRTDFVLSAEIIVLSLGVVSGQAFASQILTLVLIALVMTIGVYGLVAAIVKLDDLGLWLTQGRGRALAALGRGIIAITPWLMKALSVVGTLAMFLVGGGILVHNIPLLHHLADLWGAAMPAFLANALINVAVGSLVGAVAVALVQSWARLRQQMRA